MRQDIAGRDWILCPLKALARWIWKCFEVARHQAPREIAPMVRNDVLPRDMPSAETIRKGNAVPALPAAKAIQASAARTGHDRFDHQSRHIAGVIAHMTFHATLRTLETDGSLLAWDVENVKNHVQLRVQRQYFKLP